MPEKFFDPKNAWSPAARASIGGTINKLHRSLRYLIGELSAAGVEIPPLTTEGGMSLRALESEVRNRRTQLNALRLGVQFEHYEKASTIEERIFDKLPEVLEQRGIGVGHIIQKNHGGLPDAPHEVLGVLEDGGDTVRLRDLTGQFGDYEDHAITFALHATPYETDSQPPEPGLGN